VGGLWRGRKRNRQEDKGKGLEAPGRRVEGLKSDDHVWLKRRDGSGD
jgi:hypothetical protein